MSLPGGQLSELEHPERLAFYQLSCWTSVLGGGLGYRSQDPLGAREASACPDPAATQSHLAPHCEHGSFVCLVYCPGESETHTNLR